MPDEIYADILEVVGGQLRQYRAIDRIVAKRRLVLLHPKTVEPLRDVHARLPAALVYLIEIVGAARGFRATGWASPLKNGSLIKFYRYGTRNCDVRTAAGTARIPRPTGWDLIST